MTTGTRIGTSFALALAIIMGLGVSVFVSTQQQLDARTNAAEASAHRALLTLVLWSPLSLLGLAALAVLVTRKVRFGGPAAPPGTRDQTRGTIALRYVLALAAVLIAALLRWWLERAFGPLPPFITLYPAVLLVATIAGGGPGILASVLATLVATYFFIPPYGSFAIASASDFLALLIFTGTNLVLCVVAERLRRGRWAEAVAEQRELLAVTVGSIGDGVIVTDLHGRITFLNTVAEELTGWKLSAAQGQRLPTVFRIINEETRVPVENPADKVLRLGTVVGLANHTILVARDGREIPIDDSGAPVREADGTVHGVVLVFRDFSEKKAAEKALTLLAAIVESSADAIVSKSLDGTILTWNAGAEHLFGYAAAEIIGQPITRLVPPERVAEEEQILGRLRAGERVEHIETVRVAKDGRHIAVSVTISPLKDREGHVVGASKIARDITERLQVQEALAAAQRSAETANKAKDQFLAVLSHELRNPLSPVLATAAMLRADPRFDADTREQLDVICRNAELEARLIDDLLDVTRIERGKIQLERRPVTLEPILRGAVDVCRSDLAGRKIALALDIPDDLGVIHADTGRLQQVFWNLLKNAIKFTPEGKTVQWSF